MGNLCCSLLKPTSRSPSFSTPPRPINLEPSPYRDRNPPLPPSGRLPASIPAPQESSASEHQVAVETLDVAVPPDNWVQGAAIGQGAFGRVFQALNNATGELIAVKQVSINKEESVRDRVAEHIKALEAEVSLLSSLRHKNIVHYLGTQRTDQVLYIFMEYMPGGSIASLVEKYGPLQESVIRLYTKQILQGLDYLHREKYVHRDIKGANILLDRAGTVKLADFGASKKIEDLATIGSNARSIHGTPYWMAPEVIKQSGKERRPADIWSVGCTVIEMATGSHPWQNCAGAVQVMFQIAMAKDPPEIPDHLSPEAKDFLLLCFKRDPKERPNAARLLKHPFVTETLRPPAPPPQTTSAHTRPPLIPLDIKHQPILESPTGTPKVVPPNDGFPGPGSTARAVQPLVIPGRRDSPDLPQPTGVPALAATGPAVTRMQPAASLAPATAVHTGTPGATPQAPSTVPVPAPAGPMTAAVPRIQPAAPRGSPPGLPAAPAALPPLPPAASTTLAVQHAQPQRQPSQGSRSFVASSQLTLMFNPVMEPTWSNELHSMLRAAESEPPPQPPAAPAAADVPSESSNPPDSSESFEGFAAPPQDAAETACVSTAPTAPPHADDHAPPASARSRVDGDVQAVSDVREPPLEHSISLAASMCSRADSDASPSSSVSSDSPGRPNPLYGSEAMQAALSNSRQSSVDNDAPPPTRASRRHPLIPPLPFNNSQLHSQQFGPLHRNLPMPKSGSRSSRQQAAGGGAAAILAASLPVQLSPKSKETQWVADLADDLNNAREAMGKSGGKLPGCDAHMLLVNSGRSIDGPAASRYR